MNLRNIVIVFAIACAYYFSVHFRFEYDIEDIQEVINLDWQHGHSSTVVYGQVITDRYFETKDKKCSFSISDIRVIESFKGQYKKGDIFTVFGTRQRERQEEHTERLLFLEDLTLEQYPGLGDCNQQYLDDIKVMHMWCCLVIEDKGSKKLLLHDRIDSNTVTAAYPVDADIVFERLRTLTALASSNRVAGGI